MSSSNFRIKFARRKETPVVKKQTAFKMGAGHAQKRVRVYQPCDSPSHSLRRSHIVVHTRSMSQPGFAEINSHSRKEFATYFF